MAYTTITFENPKTGAIKGLQWVSRGLCSSLAFFRLCLEVIGSGSS